MPWVGNLISNSYYRSTNKKLSWYSVNIIPLSSSGVSCPQTVIFSHSSSDPAISLMPFCTQLATRITKGCLGEMNYCYKTVSWLKRLQSPGNHLSRRNWQLENDNLWFFCVYNFISVKKCFPHYQPEVDNMPQNSTEHFSNYKCECSKILLKNTSLQSVLNDRISFLIFTFNQK